MPPDLEEIEEAIRGKIFDRYPGLFHLSAKKISYIKGPKSLIDHIYFSPNLAARFGDANFSEKFTIVSADREIPNYVKTISDHRPIMLRLHIEDGGDVEEGVVASAALKTPDWVKQALPTS